MNDKPSLSFRDLVQRRNRAPAQNTPPNAPTDTPLEQTEIGKVFQKRGDSIAAPTKRARSVTKLTIPPPAPVEEAIVPRDHPQNGGTRAACAERRSIASEPSTRSRRSATLHDKPTHANFTKCESSVGSHQETRPSKAERSVSAPSAAVRETVRAPALSAAKTPPQKTAPVRAQPSAQKIAPPLAQHSVPAPRPQPQADAPPSPEARLTVWMWLDAMLLRWHVILFVVAIWTLSAFAMSWWWKQNWQTVAGWTLIGLGGGLIFSLPIALLSEFLDSRLRSALSVARVTKLPILGSMGNLLMMLPDERNNEGIRLWKALERRLEETGGEALICGITSSGELEGKSTLVNLLAKTASLNGYRVKIIQVRPPRRDSKTRDLSEDASLTELEDDPLRSPLAAQRFGRVQCSLDRMPALEVALEKLRQIPRLLVLVELPSAAVPETVVAAEKLPSVVWLADCNRVRARATKSQMETLRHSRARLVGAVLNHEPRSPLRRRFARANS